MGRNKQVPPQIPGKKRLVAVVIFKEEDLAVRNKAQVKAACLLARSNRLKTDIC